MDKLDKARLNEMDKYEIISFLRKEIYDKKIENYSTLLFYLEEVNYDLFKFACDNPTVLNAITESTKRVLTKEALDKRGWPNF